MAKLGRDVLRRALLTKKKVTARAWALLGQEEKIISSSPSSPSSQGMVPKSNLMPSCPGHTVTRGCSGRCQAQVPPLGAVNQAGCAPGAGRARTGPPGRASRHSLAKHSPHCPSLPWRTVAPRQPLPPGHGFPRPAPPEGPGEGPCALLGGSGFPGPRSRRRPPRHGPSAPASRWDGAGRGRGRRRDGTGRINRCNSGFSRPAAARPRTVQWERCRPGAERGQPPFAAGSPRAEGTDEHKPVPSHTRGPVHGRSSSSAQDRSPRWPRSPARHLLSSSAGRAEPSTWAPRGDARPAHPAADPRVPYGGIRLRSAPATAARALPGDS